MSKEIETVGPEGPHFELPDEHESVAAWEEVEAGRFMPRRVRGSCQGRALGWTFTVRSSREDETAK